MSITCFQSSLIVFVVVSAYFPCATIAQTMEDSAATTFEVPFGLRDAGEAEAMINGTRDHALNKVITATPGWGFSASAIGNLVNVVTQGSNNTVVINAQQINKGSQQAVVAAPLAKLNERGDTNNAALTNAPSSDAASYTSSK